MMRLLLLLALLAAPTLGVDDVPVESPAADRPVTAGLAARPASLDVGTLFDVTVSVRILAGWHIYDLDGPAPYADTKLALDLPEGLTAVGDWNEPASLADPRGSGARIWLRRANFTHRVRIDGATLEGTSIGATISFQTCNADRCLPPTSIELTAVLSAVDPWAKHRSIRVLYAGFEGGHRERVFAEFLGEWFDRVETIPLAKLSMESAASFDVVIADWVSQYGCDGYEKLEGRLHSTPVTLPDDFTRPLVAMTYVGTNLRRRHKLDWL